MKLVLILSLLYLLLCFTSNSCSKLRDKSLFRRTSIDSIYGQEIRLPFISKSFNLKESQKVVTLIDGRCHICIETLLEWDTLINDFKSYDSTLLFIVYIAYVNDSIFDYLFKDVVHIKNNYYFDFRNEFKEENNLPEDFFYHTLFLDEKNRVKLVGNPLNNRSLTDLYINKIKQ